MCSIYLTIFLSSLDLSRLVGGTHTITNTGVELVRADPTWSTLTVQTKRTRWRWHKDQGPGQCGLFMDNADKDQPPTYEQLFPKI